jgi:hypothetical protein
MKEASWLRNMKDEKQQKRNTIQKQMNIEWNKIKEKEKQICASMCTDMLKI